MKKIILLGVCAVFAVSSAFGQAKKPTIMVVPSDNWCAQNGYMTTFDNMGTEQSIPDYTAAIQQDPDLINVISKINIMMADRGFPLKDLETETKSLARDRAEASMLTSRSTGGELTVNPIQQLRDQARADIIMQLTWRVNQTGPKRSVTYNLQGLDGYTGKQVAGAQGTGAQSFATETPVLLEEAVMANMDNFCDQLQRYFDDLLTNGREINISMRTFDTSDVDFETVIDGEELLDVIDNWMFENTVQGRYNLSDSSYDYMNFEQVRMPVYDARGRAMDANRFARELRSFLSRAPYEIPCRVENQGLGQALIILGE